MIRSFYIAGTGMMTQRNKMDVIINNISNLDTTGYKQDTLLTRSFSDMLLNRLNDPTLSTVTNGEVVNATRYSYVNPVGPQNTGIHIDEIQIDFSVGNPESTGIASNLAITSEQGFFVLQTPDGNQYTRAGAFQVDVNGNLVSEDGYFVMGTGGPVNVGTTGEYLISTNGAVYVNGQMVNQVQLVDWEDRSVLRKVGNNNFVPYNNAAPAIVNATVEQGMLETSNADAATVMTQMLMTNRVYESSQRMLKMVDESLAKTVNDIGRF